MIHKVITCTYYRNVQFDDRTEVRNSKAEKRQWLAAAVLRGETITAWLRRSLNEAADFDISHRGQ